MIHSHAMVLVGYDTDPTPSYPGEIRSKFIGIVKNSWGTDWGEGGYARMAIYPGILIIPEFQYIETPITIKNRNLSVNCIDQDGDNYCNWGIGPKPDSCPHNCYEKPDCDDSNANLGPFDSNYSCSIIGAPIRDTQPPIIGNLFFDPPQTTIYYGTIYNIKVKVEDNKGISQCDLYKKSYYEDLGWVIRQKATMDLEHSYCKNCYARYSAYMPTEQQEKLFVKCWDEAYNIAESSEIVVNPVKRPAGFIMISKIAPAQATTNIPKTFSATLSSDNNISSCNFYVNNKRIGQMNLSAAPCRDCTASINHKFTSKGTYSAYAECKDTFGNMAAGEPVDIVVSDAPQYVTVRPINIYNKKREVVDPNKVELNETVTIASRVSSTSGKKIAGCFLMVNNQSQGQMNLMSTNCYDCEIWKDHIFTKKGIHPTYIKCVDEGGNMGENDLINIVTIDKQCPELEYPTHMWQNVWYELSGNKKGACIGEGFNQSSIKFNNNWGMGTIAFGRSDNLYLTSGRTINLPVSGEYVFTVGSDDGVKVWIDDELVLDKWIDRGYTTNTFSKYLSAGNHKFRIDYYEKSWNARLSFTFQEPASSPAQYTLNVSKSGAGSGIITSNPSGINCGSTCSANFDSQTSVTLTATPFAGSTFAGWSGACSGTSSTCTVSMNSNKSVTASFNQATTYTLTINKNTAAGGIIQGTPAVYCGTNCGPRITMPFNAGTTVTLNATPSSGYIFGGWSGACSGTGTCTIIMNSDKSVSASFIGGLTPAPTPTRTPTPTPTLSGAWTPCDPTYGWQCDRITGGNPPYCSGAPISWGSGDDGLVYCPEGQIAISGICEKKNDDYVKESKEIINLLPHPQVVSSMPIIFKPRSAWYCKFGCTGLFCGPDGCGWVYCKAGQIQVQRIELQIFDATGRLVFQRKVDNQNQISWDGKSDKGEYLANGFYIFQAKTYLKDGRVFTNQDKVYIQR